MELVPSLLSTLRTLDPGALDQEYNAVRSQTTTLKRDLSLTTEAGVLKENSKKNRYKDILPYDQSRVVLSLPTSDSDYINASLIKGATAAKSYIAAQAPLSSTVTDFWRMIWQHNVKVIVMACREVEMGKQGEKHPNEDIVIRSLTVSYQQDSRSVIQYQFLSWPDHDVPYKPAGVLDLLERARNSQGTDTSPLLVHCSAGCGRTGVICTLDYIYDLLVTKQLTADFSVMKIVLELRTQRPSAVQTKDQYQFIFTAVVCMLERAMQSTEHHLYCNVSELKKSEKKTTPVSSAKRSSKQIDMNDMYAVVNKPKHSLPSPTSPAYPAVAPPRLSRMLPSTHHYDNDSAGASAAPVYSTVKPRGKSNSPQVSAPPMCDMAIPANHRAGEGALVPDSNRDYHMVSAECISSEDDYEDVSSSISDMTNFCSPGGIGFNCRIQKPRGPRDPPAEWSRLER